mmetsp:Transcript_27921/g.60841  ORF Transcript_27921/g.60841 Transcript_27921/m.60841 type:complete len:337 (-) Transcript_27921:1614-2624(-)
MTGYSKDSQHCVHKFPPHCINPVNHHLFGKETYNETRLPQQFFGCFKQASTAVNEGGCFLLSAGIVAHTTTFCLSKRLLELDNLLPLCRRVKLDVKGHPFLPLPHHGALFVGESGREHFGLFTDAHALQVFIGHPTQCTRRAELGVKNGVEIRHDLVNSNPIWHLLPDFFPFESSDTHFDEGCLQDFLPILRCLGPVDICFVLPHQGINDGRPRGENACLAAGIGCPPQQIPLVDVLFWGELPNFRFRHLVPKGGELLKIFFSMHRIHGEIGELLHCLAGASGDHLELQRLQHAFPCFVGVHALQIFSTKGRHERHHGWARGRVSGVVFQRPGVGL